MFLRLLDPGEKPGMRDILALGFWLLFRTHGGAS